jgi:hypothetical protein
MQSGLLFQSLYTPGSDAYFVQTLLNLEGRIDTAAFKSAWQKICGAHPIFRTGIFWETLETPLQYLLEFIELPLVVENWNGLASENLETFLKEDRKRGFDLSKPPLFRLTLIQWDARKTIL